MCSGAWVLCSRLEMWALESGKAEAWRPQENTPSQSESSGESHGGVSSYRLDIMEETATRISTRAV